MNNYLKPTSTFFQKIMLFFLTIWVTVPAIAQDKQVDVNINSNKGSNFWGQPWVWVVGAALFILLLVAILRSGRRSD